MNGQLWSANSERKTGEPLTIPLQNGNLIEIKIGRVYLFFGENKSKDLLKHYVCIEELERNIFNVYSWKYIELTVEGYTSVVISGDGKTAKIDRSGLFDGEEYDFSFSALVTGLEGVCSIINRARFTAAFDVKIFSAECEKRLRHQIREKVNEILK